MAKSLLQGKRFFCREWAFAKISHCLESRPTSKTCGALIMGGPGCGKTALCCETVWPRSSHGKQRALSKRVLAYHFCQAHDIETLSITNFILSIVKQISESNLICGYEEKLKEPNIQAALEYMECERDPDEAFKQAVLLPLLALNPPQHTVFIVVDSIDESYLQVVGDRNSGSRTIAELLANHHQLFPQWLLLVCSARKQSKSVTRMFTGFRKISLDDLRKSHVVRDVQQYILCRLDQEELLRQHLSRDTAEMLNQLHIKSNGCFLYLEKVLDGVAENFIMLREIREIPGTLNGLYLWLCQRLFVRKQFTKIQPILNVILAARRPLTDSELYQCAWTRNTTLTPDEFSKRMDLLSKILIDGTDSTKILFHHSFAEWLLDVKHCTQKYLCNAAEGHGMLAMSYTLNAINLTPQDVQDFALHLSKTNLCPSLQPFHIPLWLIICGAPIEDALTHRIPKEQKVVKLLLDAGARVATTSDLRESSNPAPGEREDSLRMLLDNGAMVNQVDANQRTLLHNAAYQGNLLVVSLLISRGAELEAIDKNGQTALNLAARQGHLDVVSALLTASANVDHADNDGWTALRSAAWGGHTDVVGVLLNAGAQVDSADSDDRTALRAAAWGGHDDIVLKLLQHGAEVDKVDNEGRTALIAAAYMGHVEIVEHLLDHGAEINHEDTDGRTALSVAALCIPASEGHAGVVSLLLDRNAEVDHKDKDGMTPLLVAAYEGHRDVCELLLESEADMDHSDNNGRTPLLAAASMGHAAVVNLLLFWGAAVDTIDSEGRTVLSIAAAQGNADVVRQLLDRGLDEMHRDNGGWTPLHYAGFEGHKEVCDALLESGARINEVDNDGRHPLILAAQEGHAAAVSSLLNHGAMIDHRSHDGKTALRVAALEGHKDIVHLLLCSGSDINYKDADGRSSLYILALENKVQLAAFLLENGAEVEATDFEGRTPLHVSAWQGHYDIVELLLTHCAQVNAIDADRRTALQSASWQGHTAVVRLLLERGAFVDHTCNQGATALCIAAQEGHEDVVRVLLKFNADPGHADQFGRNAVGVALKGGHMNVVKLLEEHGAPVNGFSNIRQSSASVTSCSTAETKPSSAVLTGFTNGLHSNSVDSPESTLDKRRSYISNQSSSKSSSNLTSSSTNQSAAQPPTESSHGLSFTQQLQQCTRNRNRPISRVLSPLSEPQSPPQSPPGSPLSDVQSSRLSPVQNLFPQSLAPTTKLENFSPTPIPQIITNPHLLEVVTNANNIRTYGRSSTQPITIPSPNQTPEMPRKSSLPLSLQDSHFQNIIGCRSPDMKLRRNGIVTNPNYKGGNGNTPKVVVNPLDGGNIFVTNGNPTSPQLGYKQPIKTSYDAPARPNGLPIRKETPL